MVRAVAVALATIASVAAQSGCHPRPPHAESRAATAAAAPRVGDELAQGAPTPPHDSIVKKFVGTWEGTLESPHGSTNGLKLVITYAKAGWAAAMTMPPGTPMQAGAMTDVKVNGSGLAWTQAMGRMSCKGSATLVGESLKGETDCGHVGLAFLLTRK
jgi:hypothetical protein